MHSTCIPSWCGEPGDESGTTGFVTRINLVIILMWRGQFYIQRGLNVFSVFIRLWWFIIMLARYPYSATGGILVYNIVVYWDITIWWAITCFLLVILNNLSENRVNPNPEGLRPHTPTTTLYHPQCSTHQL